MKALDLFCGAGGIAQGFLKAGFDVTGVDNSDSVEATFSVNNHASFVRANLDKENIESNCDVITGGPPCKPWSSVNVKRRRIDHRDHRLVSHFFRHVQDLSPPAFLFENVPPLQYDPILLKHLKSMEKFGYSVKGEIIKYSDYGAATARKRLIVFGTRKGVADTFFQMLNKRRRRAATVKDAIWDLRHIKRSEVVDHEWPELRTIQKYKKYYESGKFGWYILEWDKPAPSFGNIMKTYILHPFGFSEGKPRVISIREAMLIMGFDRSFQFPSGVGLGHRYQMVVDSVSPVFSYLAAQVIRDFLDDKSPK